MTITRRQALAGLTLGTAASAAPQTLLAQAAPAARNPALLNASMCVLTPQAVEGPFYFDPKLKREDITEGKPGVPLKVLLQVVNAASCAPIPDARVDIWHSDASGEYSGYKEQPGGAGSTEGKTFMRGTQLADLAGLVRFTTIYPGWYQGRTPHIHFKVFLSEKMALTGQLYFPDALSEFIYKNAVPYNTRKRERDTVNGNDGVLRMSGGGHETFCSIKEEADHYLASLVIGVRDDGTEAVLPEMGPPPGGPPPGGPGGPGGRRPPPGPREGPPPQQQRPRGGLIPGVKS
jgi:protocatechuate 3,4-dioxygenase beta subunit